MKRIFKRVNWLNVFLILLFIASAIDLGSVFIKLCWSIASLTWFGVVTTLASITIFSVVGEYLYDEYKEL